MMRSLKELIPLKLKEARDTAGLEQTDVAEVLGLSKGAYGHYETGRNEPSIETLIVLAGYYKRPLTWFVGLPPEGNLNDKEAELVTLFRSLPLDMDKDFVLDMLRRFAKGRGPNNQGG